MSTSLQAHPAAAATIAVAARPRRSARRFSPPGLVLGAIGVAAFLAAWYVAVDVLALPRFEILPGPTEVAREWTSRDPDYGVSLFTASYYQDIWVSLRRVLIAFAGALALGVPLGLWLGWSRRVREYGWIVAGDRVSAGSGGEDRDVEQPGGLRHGSAAR